MRWRRPDGGVIVASDQVVVAFSAAMHAALAGPERGGILLGRRMGGSGTGGDIIIERALGPDRRDRAGRFAFTRGAHHQVTVDRAWSDSGGAVNFLGDWHSHPEAVPRPSGRDLATWARLVDLQWDEHLPLVFVIVGANRVQSWELGRRSAPRATRLLNC